ncbi:MAG: DUF1835 domain-containing protein [Gemmatimonadota bacterium]|jgi:hypothetical protein
MNGDEPVRHVTNGDSAAMALRSAGVTGGILAWRDVLHDGPVPADLTDDELTAVRATFIADRGWAGFTAALEDFRRRDRRLQRWVAEGEVVLWFERDLYDQLQLIQAIDRLASLDPAAVLVTMTVEREFIPHLSPARIRTLFEQRVEVGVEAREVAKRTWAAFRAPTPEAMAALTVNELPALPFLRAALVRMLEEYPAPDSGLSRTERQILDEVAAGAASPAAAFRACQAREESMFMGDASFWPVLQRLLVAYQPLLSWQGLRPAAFPPSFLDDRRFLDYRLELTDAGRAAKAGRIDHVEVNGIDRWIGGVHLVPGNVWRWNREARRLIAPE